MVRTVLMLLLSSSHNNRSRSVEYMLAWLMIGWGAAVAASGDILVGPTSRFFLNFATEAQWATVALGIGSVRLFALIVNGAWRRTPLLRFACAAIGMAWWTIMLALYWVAIQGGAPPFPNLSIYPVFVFFEAYSCFRCGQDAAELKSFGRERHG